MDIRNISFNIYASSDEEAERGRQAIIKFIDFVGQRGAKVSGNKLSDAVEKMQHEPFIVNQIIHFFKS